MTEIKLLEMKTTIFENILDGIDSRLDITQKNISTMDWVVLPKFKCWGSNP